MFQFLKPGYSREQNSSYPTPTLVCDDITDRGLFVFSLHTSGLGPLQWPPQGPQAGEEVPSSSTSTMGKAPVTLLPARCTSITKLPSGTGRFCSFIYKWSAGYSQQALVHSCTYCKRGLAKNFLHICVPGSLTRVLWLFLSS